jgi:hypothetical protein
LARDGHLFSRRAVMPAGSTVVRQGVQVIQGTPQRALERPTLFLRMWKDTEAGQPPRTFMTLAMARPGLRGYVIKDLIPQMESPPQAALDKAVAIARRGDVTEIYLNADLTRLPALPLAAGAA